MMIWLVIAALAAYFAVRYFVPQGSPLKQAFSAAGVAAAVGFLLRVGLGRILGVFGVLAAFAPIINHLYLRYASRESADHSPAGGTLTRAEAAALLGVAEDASEEEIDAAYRKLMAKVHPDAGGTSALAQQLNTARDILLS